MSFSEKRDLSAQQPLKITFFTLLTLVLCLIFLPSSFSATINLAWNSSTGLNVAGYKVYYGSASKSYSKNVNVGNNTSCSLSGLTEGRKYYFAATAYNASNNESDYSSEISYTIPVSSSSSSSTSSSSTTGSTNTLIIDNGSSGTSATGSWKVSSASGFYGSNSIYSNTKASTYSFQATRSGSQRVYFWYTQFSNRCTSVPVAIYDGSTLLKTLTVNQQKNGAQWNDLGTYAFSSSAKVVATAPGSCITSVDAIKFAPSSSTSTTTPTTSTSTTTPTTSTSTSGSSNTAIIDNGSSGTSATGSWKVSSASGFYGSNSIYSNTKASTYSFQATRSGSQTVYFWYTQFSNRCTSVPVAIYDGSTLLKTVTVNQQKNGAQWNDLGTYAFSSSAKVVATAPGSCITSVDAIKFAPASSTSAPTPTTSTSTSGSSNTAIIDNGSSGTSATGSWKVSSASGFYGSNSVYSDRSSDTYSFEAPVSGSREVHIWYTQYSNRCKSVPIKIYSGSTDLDTVNVNQQQNGGQWNDLGTYDFDGKAKIIISSNGGCITSADAVKLVPTSSAASATSSSSSEPPATGSIIVDNGDNGTMPSGSWKVSSAPGFYASSSLYSVTASNTYAYEAACSGVKEVYLWWVSFDNRCTKVPVRIYDGSTYLETVEVNQQQNGGQWNELGTYSFSGRARVVVVSNGGCVTSADAVNFFEPN